MDAAGLRTFGAKYTAAWCSQEAATTHRHRPKSLPCAVRRVASHGTTRIIAHETRAIEQNRLSMQRARERA
jgi:hypothetical protein